MDMKTNFYQDFTVEELNECFSNAFKKLDLKDQKTISFICQDVAASRKNIGKASALELIAKTGIFLCGGKDDRIA